MEQVLNDALKKSHVPSISVAIISDGKLAYAGAVGNAKLTPEQKASVETRYAVGSISKQFTAAAILLAAEGGKLSLDDTVGKYFPDLTSANEITIRQLLSHTSGYEDYAPQDYIIPEWTQPITASDIIRRWARKPLNFDPGTRWQYSNTNYVLAGKIFEKATGEDLMAYLKRHIFDPVGIHTAGDCSVSKSEHDATAYTRYALGPPRPALREAGGWYFAAGELCMTPSDLALWNLAILEKRVLSPESYREFTTEVKLKDGSGTHYALGLDVHTIMGVPSFSHGGEVSGFLTRNIVFPTRNAAVAVCSNQDNSGIIFSVAEEISRMLVNAEEPAPASEISQVTQILQGLTQGKIDRTLFTSNANAYFSSIALDDFHHSLEALGKLQSVTRVREDLRGGMTHRSYRAVFEKRPLSLNVYVTNEGKYEQFLVAEQL